MRRRATQIALLLVAILGVSGCAATRAVVAHFQSTSRFVPLAADPRIVYEPGAEAFAQAVAPLLPQAIADVEAGQYRPFARPVVVHVCATEYCFTRFTGASARAKGAVHGTQGLFLNPALLRQPERMRAILTHELSHLHLVDHVRLWALPVWFNEGLAAYVSGGGGAEHVSEADAVKAIAAGNMLEPMDSGTWLSYNTAGPFRALGMAEATHMFYRQSMMFVAYLKQRDPQGFRGMLLALEDGTDFAHAFSSAYGAGAKALWAEFAAATAASSP
jgi:hypothetical protein